MKLIKRTYNWLDMPVEYIRPGDDERPEVKRLLEGGTMIECRMCHHQFNDKRPRCPACGTEPKARPASFNSPRVTHAKANECVLCHRGGAKVECAICGARVHAQCAGVHRDREHSTQEAAS